MARWLVSVEFGLQGAVVNLMWAVVHPVRTVIHFGLVRAEVTTDIFCFEGAVLCLESTVVRFENAAVCLEGAVIVFELGHTVVRFGFWNTGICCQYSRGGGTDSTRDKGS